MKCTFCNQAIRFWQRAQYIEPKSVDVPGFWRTGGMAHCDCADVYFEGVEDGKCIATPLKKDKK